MHSFTAWKGSASIGPRSNHLQGRKAIRLCSTFRLLARWRSFIGQEGSRNPRTTSQRPQVVFRCSSVPATCIIRMKSISLDLWRPSRNPHQAGHLKASNVECFAWICRETNNGILIPNRKARIQIRALPFFFRRDRAVHQKCFLTTVIHSL
jgi:hypothetical protein